MERAARHRLYEEAVQTPEHDVEHLGRLFRRRVGRPARSLREDFCGTALLSVRWVESDDEREAVGVDLDREVLAYGSKHHLAGLDADEAMRVTLVRGDVRALSDRTFDLVVAMNFSWALFDDRDLGTYLANARACLEPDGLIVLEAFGGEPMREALVREHPHDGFTYVWEQRGVEDGVLEAAIHFRVDGPGGAEELRDAFRYRFHLRDLDAVRAALEAAGLRGVELLVEDARGRYVRRARAPRRLHRAWIVAGA